MTGKTNLAASVAARLLNRARQTGDDYQTLLTSYCLERFLYRLAVSDRRERFVLKGAMLLRLWSERPYRATLDLDLLRRGDGAFDAIKEDLRAIVATPVPLDAVDFDGERITMEAIRAEDEYAGTRATLPARCGKARVFRLELRCPACGGPLQLIAALTDPGSIGTYLDGVGLHSRPPPIAPARLVAQPELDFAA
jgi:hypothetical protein